MSRDAILKSIKQNQPAALPLPDAPTPRAAENPEQLALFTRMVEAVGGRCLEAASAGDVASRLQHEYADAGMIISTVSEINIGSCKPTSAESTTALDALDLAIIPGRFGVAENGAVWVTAGEMGQRIVPFICAHLAIVLDRRALVDDMHQAYARLQNDRPDYGVFISGPSKTADIEQCLVIGAHGPLSLTVFLL